MGNWDTLGDMLTQAGEEVVLASRYHVIRKLGDGGMGSVWLAKDAKLDDREVAIKMLPAVLAANDRAIRQLKAEAKLAMHLSHPHLVALRSFEEEAEGAFLVLDFIEGKTLEEALTEKRTLSEEEVVSIFQPLAEALDYAHSRNVIHRDIKPSNILIATDGTPYITDFGIALYWYGVLGNQ